VGQRLTRLKMEREQLDKALEETLEFNDRIENPEAWRKVIKKRQ
jgi:hypothetical protein